jgi:hypothetical protein
MMAIEITVREMDLALIRESQARGFCWCAVPMRAMVDCRGTVHASCQQMITDESYALTAKERGNAVLARLGISDA